MNTAFALPAYWDRARVERARQKLVDLRYRMFVVGVGPSDIDDAIEVLYYILNPDKISHDTSDGPIGMDEVDHD